MALLYGLHDEVGIDVMLVVSGSCLLRGLAPLRGGAALHWNHARHSDDLHVSDNRSSRRSGLRAFDRTVASSARNRSKGRERLAYGRGAGLVEGGCQSGWVQS